MKGQENRAGSAAVAAERELDKRLETIGWGLFLIMIGGIWLVPGDQLPEGTWLLGAGLIMLGVNAARYLNGLKTRGFTLVLGTLALLSGAGDLLGTDLPVLAILLILVGANLLLKPWLERKAD